MDASLEMLVTVGGNAAVTVALVAVIRKALDMSPAAVDRFGPLLAILVGIVVAEFGALALGQSGRDLAAAVLTGLVSGLSSQGLYNTLSGPVSAVKSMLP